MFKITILITLLFISFNSFCQNTKEDKEIKKEEKRINKQNSKQNNGEGFLKKQFSKIKERYNLKENVKSKSKKVFQGIVLASYLVWRP
jgi:sortase (surface protein transpeptidase)